MTCYRLFMNQRTARAPPTSHQAAAAGRSTLRAARAPRAERSRGTSPLAPAAGVPTCAVLVLSTATRIPVAYKALSLLTKTNYVARGCC